ncbi:MAG: SurA N-terminal domain-containing protein [Mesorhizobium sp.]
MLSILRSAAGTWVAKGLLLLLVVSFAIWGISGQLAQDFAANSVLTAGQTTVSPNEFRLAYDRQLQLLSQQFGQRISREQASALGIDQQVLAQLAAGAVLDEQARAMGLGVSLDHVGELARNDPAFQGAGGAFDRQQFEYVLRQNGIKPDDYLQRLRAVGARQQLQRAVSEGLKAPDAFLRAVALYRGEDRTADYLVLPPSLVQPIEGPDADALTKWFEENKKTYAAPEYRKIAYLKLEPEDIADPAAITDDQVKADYEANKAKFTAPETRTLEQIVFPTPDAAKAAREKIRSGASFEDIVKGEGKSLADAALGTFSKDKVADPAVADAAFGLKPGEVSEVVAGSFGPVLVRVTQVTPEKVRSLDEMKDEIRRDLALAEASRILLDVHDSYEDARAGGATMREAADRAKLKLVEIEAVDRAARRPDGSVLDTLPQSQALLAAAFETEPGAENPPLNIGSSGFLFYEVEGVTPARDKTLDEVRETVVADWKAAETKSRLAKKAEEVAKRIKDGTPLETIAGELKLEKQTKRGLKREADDADIGKAGVAAVFAKPQGGSGVFAAPQEDAEVVFKVTEVFEPAGAGPETVPEEARNSFAAGMTDDLLDQLVARLQGEYPVAVDQRAIERALAF